MEPSKEDKLLIAREAWGDALPDWVQALAEACDLTSQNAVAKRLKRSAPLVSNVISHKYAADMTAIEERVRGVLMKAVVDCPALGELPTDVCQTWRQGSRRFAGHNALRVRMYRACNRCPINRRAEP